MSEENDRIADADFSDWDDEGNCQYCGASLEDCVCIEGIL